MKFGEESGKIYKTKDYSIFKTMNGNRDFEKHGQRLVPSVEQWGIIMPIIVNEKMEVVDGQGRLYAAKETGAEVPYIIKPKMDVNTCLEMNTTQKSWTMVDYIKSYASRGYDHYIMLESAMKSYKNVPTETLCFALVGVGGYERRKLAAGQFKVSTKNIKLIEKSLEFLEDIASIKAIDKNLPGRKARFYIALLYSTRTDGFNAQAMRHALERHVQNPDILLPFNSVASAVRSIEKAYNYGKISDKKINLVGFFNDAQTKGLTWWGEKRREQSKNGN